MPMDDEIYDANIELKALPNNKVVITFYGGQDGCMSYLLSFENEKLKVAKQLPNDVDFCCMLNEKRSCIHEFLRGRALCNELSIAKNAQKAPFLRGLGSRSTTFQR